MKNIYKLSALLFLAFGLFSCEEPIDLSIEGMDKQYFVDGDITTDLGNQQISFFYTKDYASNNTFEPVTDATVSVLEMDSGQIKNTYPFSYQSELKKYVSNAVFAGQAGYSYKLHIQHGTNEIVAEEKMKAIWNIDSFIFVSLKIPFDFDTTKRDTTLMGWTWEANDSDDDAYIWDTYINGKLLTDSLRRRTFTNDDGLNGNYISGISFVQGGYLMEGNKCKLKNFDTLTISTSRINERYFQYLLQVMLSTDWSAGPFSGPPSNPLGNLILNGESKGVQGYFATRAIARHSAIYLDFFVFPIDF